MNIQTELNVLNLAPSILDRGWCRRAFARDLNGNNVKVTDNRAASFCLHGACFRASYELADTSYDSHKVNGILRKLIYIVPPYEYLSSARWNDRIAKDKEEVQALLKKAARYVEVAYFT